jgi:hypothetical protein
LQSIVDYCLFTDDVIELDKHDIEANYLVDKKLEFDNNIVDFVNRTLFRTGEDYTMKIDFNKQTCELVFEEGNTLVDIESSLTFENNVVTIIYSFGEEKKKIVISLKETL